MKMTVPTTCKQHPESQAVITIRTPKGDAPYRLRRHWCGELNCNIPLGWQYRTRTRHITTGAGACEHPEVLQDLQADQETNTSANDNPRGEQP